MRLQTVVRASLNGDSDGFCLALFTKQDSLFHTRWGVARQSVVQVAYKVVTVILVKGHKSSSHYNKFDFVRVVPKSLQLLNAISCLKVGIIAGADCSHRSWLVASVALGRVFKVRVWSTWAVHANVACHSDVRTPVGFWHNSNDCYSRCRPNRLSFQERCKFIFVAFG